MQHADRRKAWARAFQDDLEDTYRENIVSGNSTRLTLHPCDRDVWRSSVRSAMPAASRLPGREHTDVDDAPASACYVNLNADDDESIQNKMLYMHEGKNIFKLECAVDGTPLQIPTLKFLTPKHAQVPPLGHDPTDPGNRMKISFNMFLSFICENTHKVWYKNL